MLDIDFSKESTRRLHTKLTEAYQTRPAITMLVQRAGLLVGELPEADSIASLWQAFLVKLRQSKDGVEKLLDAVLKDTSKTAYHDDIRAFINGQVESFVIGPSDPTAALQLLCSTLHRDLGEDAKVISQKLIDRIAGSNISGAELFDATRFAIEYQLLVSDDLSSTRLLEVARGGRKEEFEEFRRLLRDGLKAKALREITVKVRPHEFFSRALERKRDWYAYFEAVGHLSESDPTLGISLCRIRGSGFLSPQYLIAGLLQEYDNDWRPIIMGYRHQIGGTQSTFASFQASQWNTWLMWGPSVPICQCPEWEGIHALQYGYGDETNSIPIIGGTSGAPESLAAPAAVGAEEPAPGAVFHRRMTGRLRWAPWLLQRSSGPDPGALEKSGEFPLVGVIKACPAARAQRSMYEKDRLGHPGSAMLFQVEDLGTPDPGDSYFSAYLWLMFLVARKPAAPGQAPRRLADTYPELNARAADRRAKRLWRELLPVYVHANIADARALAMQRHQVVNNAVSLLRDLWLDQAAQFPGVDKAELCFYLVGGSDYSGCGHQIRYPSPDSLIKRLRARLAEEPDRDFASSVVLPPDDETAATRPPELIAFYSTCHLPELVADYYSYVDQLKEE